MTEKDITQIKVGRFSMSIIGIKQVIREMAGTHAGKSDEEIGAEMLRRLEKDNYISPGAKEDYRKAFVREFRKSLGQPFTEDVPEVLDIKVLGSGCAQCRNLSQIVMDVLAELNMTADFNHVTEMKEIAGYGVMGVPALLINRKVMTVGSVPPKERVKKWILEADASRQAKKG